MTRNLLAMAAVCAVMFAADAPQTEIAKWIEAQGGELVRGPDGSIVEVSLARTWATDNDIDRVVAIKGLKRLDLSFTYVTDRGIERLQQLQQLEELRLDTSEFITDAALSYLRANRRLTKLVLRGTDITDVGMPFLAELTALKSVDLSHTMLGDVGLESLPALTNIEELNLGGDHISGINLNFLKLLPKLRSLSLSGIQRRNAGACWTPLITDLDLETISQLTGLEELNLGVGVSLGRTGVPVGPGNCKVTGGIRITDPGLVSLGRLRNLRRLDVSGAKITPAGLKPLAALPRLERLSLWNCAQIDDSAASALSALRSLVNLDLSYTPVGDATMHSLAGVHGLKTVYLTDTKVTPAGVAEFRKQKPAAFVSWGQRPPAIPKPPARKDAKDEKAQVELP